VSLSRFRSCRTNRKLKSLPQSILNLSDSIIESNSLQSLVTVDII